MSYLSKIILFVWTQTLNENLLSQAITFKFTYDMYSFSRTGKSRFKKISSYKFPTKTCLYHIQSKTFLESQWLKRCLTSSSAVPVSHPTHRRGLAYSTWCKKIIFLIIKFSFIRLSTNKYIHRYSTYVHIFNITTWQQ